ncbi:DUF3667 domain-containing protein [Flavobacterium sp. 3HN19-14]|uniref:DUF3667 domain-containing protein n=1 Tax=Flavobacterium sp. 3HN19-14 TaxID=3448133 RepID=UPI003EE3F4D3
MSEVCKNCETEIISNFCGNCGQKKVKRIDRNYVKDEVQYILIHTNKGFFYSVKCLIRNPGKTAREFVEGNRINHYKPLALVFILSGIVAFINTAFIHQEDIYSQFNNMGQGAQPVDMKPFMEKMMHYYSFVMLLNVPIMALFTWIGYKKWGYNYYENIIICAYYLALLMVFNLVVIIPIQLLLKEHVMLFMLIPSILSTIIAVGTYFWFFIGLYSDRSPGM